MPAANLHAILSAYPPDCRPLAPPEPLGNAGGLSGSTLFRFPSGRGPLLARAWPQDGPARQDLVRIHGWLFELRHLGFVPVPIPDESSRTLRLLDGRFWQVEPWMPGLPDPSRPPAPPRLKAGMAAIAGVHATLRGHASEGPSPGIVARIREVRAWCRGGFDELRDALASAGPGVERDLAVRWVDLARRMAPLVEGELTRKAGTVVPLQPCLRDARSDHLLFEGDRVAGLVDFGAMGVESPAADLARLLADWVGEDRERWGEALSAYEAARRLDFRTTALIPVFDRSAALLMGGHWARWAFLEGRTFESPDAIAKGLAHGVERLASLAANRGPLD